MQRSSLLAWLVGVVMLAGCGPLETSYPSPPPNVVVAEISPTTNASSTPVNLTPTPFPTQPGTETSAPIPSETSMPHEVIEHLAVGQAVTIVSLDMLDAQNGWASGGMTGETGHVLRTVDGGLTWQDVTPPQSSTNHIQPLQSVAGFLDTQLAWVFYMQADSTPGDPAVVWHTQDGGAHWQASQPLDLEGLENQFYVTNLQFADSHNGWLLAHVGVGMNHDYVMLYRTQDGGATWQRLIDPYMDGGIQACRKTGMLFTDAQHGWLPGDCNGVAPGAFLYHTSDGGATWEMVNLPAPTDLPTLFENPAAACGVYDVTFFTPEFGRAAMICANYDTDPLSNLYYLYTTNDGGTTWTSTVYPGGSLTFLNDRVGWAQNEDIFQTTDGGTTWTKISLVSWQAKFDFVSETLGWAVASAGDEVALVKSEDGGIYWSEVKPLITP